jgi:cobyrinic acid a,c-diamide synthase
VVGFDPLRDEALPSNVDGLVIGGGFPEIHAAELSANTALRADIAALARAGAPVVAECAGLLYLSRSLDGQPMCGVLDIDTAMTDRLTLGYREAVARVDSPLAARGHRVHGHEFHRTAVEVADTEANAWTWAARGTTVTEGFAQGNLHASYLHTHWSGSPGTAERLVAAAERYRTTQRARAASGR